MSEPGHIGKPRRGERSGGWVPQVRQAISLTSGRRSDLFPLYPTGYVLCRFPPEPTGHGPRQLTVT